VGDLKGAFQGLLSGDITALPQFFKSATGAAGGFTTGLNGIKVALISTGIGALLVGIGLAVAALTQYFKGTEEGQLAFMRVMNSIKSVTQPIIAMFGKFGKAIFELFSGKWEAAWNTARGAVTGLGDAIKTNRENLDELNAAQEKFLVSNDDLTAKATQLEADIADLRERAADAENYSAKERLAMMNQAIIKQKEYAAIQKEITQNELNFKQLKASQGDATLAVNDEIEDLQNQIIALDGAESKALKKLESQRKTINKEVEKQLALEAEIKRVTAAQAEYNANPLQKMQPASVTGVASTAGPQNMELANMDSSAAILQTRLTDLNSTYTELTNNIVGSVGDIGSSFQAIGDAIGGAAGSWISFTGKVLQSIPSLITQITALRTANASNAIAGAVSGSAALPPPWNIISIGASIAAVLAGLATSIPKFAAGGIVPGSSFYGDRVLAGLNSGEMVLNKSQQSNLFNQIQGGGGGKDMRIEVFGSLSGDLIRITNKRAERKNKQFNG